MMRLPLLVCLVAGCSAATSDPGVSAGLQVAHATFQAGAMPGDGSGPPVIALNLPQTNILAGAVGLHLGGTLDAGATAVAVGLDGDSGFWIVPAGAPDTFTPTMPGVATTLSFSRTLAPGPTRIVAHAVDEAGTFGPAFFIAINIVDTPGPTGSLVVSLRWSGHADLDLHVIDPAGTELWAGNPVADGGQLDLDSNTQCVFDGRAEENAIWQAPPAPGQYTVRVDTFSLCGDLVTDWVVEAYLEGNRVAAASGTSVDTDTIGPHQRGAGRDAIVFDVPAP
jgi:hypothetical protein